ncbi:MAG: VWA domain-containing protein [Zhongshania sp.]|uniref:VWA domain-containing protein n=1 Tax=Zhongshania sp. TaxID=1971902 RepID=UPI002630EA59|nr:VWA domain-containing protein [Zhongshania sp.]MDF1693193.1 VWA domain-containing protein [Zhongshania sp.]
MTLPSLHWIRPDLLWTAIPLIIAALLLARQSRQQGAWQKHIDPSLLPYLLDGKSGAKPARSLTLLFLLSAIAWLALLGPAWEQAPTPLYKNTEGMVVVLDLSPSMLAEDIQPSRIRQARFKLRDLLQLRQDGQTGLVVFAADAFVVAPLTDDVNTLLTLIPGLHPGMMPQIGSNPLAGVTLAKDLLDQNGGSGRILLITDGINKAQLNGLQKFLDDSPYPLSVLAVGTRDGAPIPLPEGGFAKDSSGNIIVPALSVSELRALASSGNGDYRELSLDDSDIRALNPDDASSAESATGKNSERQFDQWKDAGAWLVLLLLPLSLLGFRRSWLPNLLLPLLLPLLLLAQPNTANALEFNDLWQTPDQRGAALLERDPAAAAEHFKDPAWRASAQYRAGDYAAAAESYAQLSGSDAAYNRGNALAKAGKLNEAIAAFEEALAQDPDMSDAQRNKAIVEDLKKQQEQQQDQSQDQSQKGDGDKSDKDQQSESSDQQDQDGKDSNQKENQDGKQGDSSQQDKSEQQNSDQKNNGKNDQQNDKSESQDATEQDQTESSADQEKQQQAEQRKSELADDYAKQAAEQKPGEDAPDADPKENGKPAGAVESQAPLSEADQSKEQWLRKIPDNPDNLLRNKFQYQHQLRQHRGEQIEREDYAPY